MLVDVAMGQKRTWLRLSVMSALPRKQTSGGPARMLAKLPTADIQSLLNHLVGAAKQYRWHL